MRDDYVIDLLMTDCGMYMGIYVGMMYCANSTMLNLTPLQWTHTSRIPQYKGIE